MARGPGALKRQKEIARLEWQREKEAKRKQRKLDKLNPRPEIEPEQSADGADPNAPAADGAEPTAPVA